MEKLFSQAEGSNGQACQQQKSSIMLWREKYPQGLGGSFTNMKAVLR